MLLTDADDVALVFTCSNSTIQTLEKDAKCIQG